MPVLPARLLHCWPLSPGLLILGGPNTRTSHCWAPWVTFPSLNRCEISTTKTPEYTSCISCLNYVFLYLSLDICPVCISNPKWLSPTSFPPPLFSSQLTPLSLNCMSLQFRCKTLESLSLLSPPPHPTCHSRLIFQNIWHLYSCFSPLLGFHLSKDRRSSPQGPPWPRLTQKQECSPVPGGGATLGQAAPSKPVACHFLCALGALPILHARFRPPGSS